ncbi:hypothetical protein ABG067_000965 [Albugo candida]
MHIESSSDSLSDSNDVYPIRPKQKSASTRPHTVNGKAEDKQACLLKLDALKELLGSSGGQKPKISRRQLREKFCKYDKQATGIMTKDNFKKCLDKTGMHMLKETSFNDIIDCFADVSSTTVDYNLFLECICNVRVSENMSSIAENLRYRILRSNGKASATSKVKCNLFKELLKLDKLKRGWITDEQFEEYLEKDDRRSGVRFHLEQNEIDWLLERFSFQFGRHQHGIDYQLFASWIQPSQHFDMDRLRDTFQKLLRVGIAKRGWDIEYMLEALDTNHCRYISENDLRRLIQDLGLPLSEAQIQYLIEIYDKNHDGKIIYKNLLTGLGDKRTPDSPRKKSQVDPGQGSANTSANNQNTILRNLSSRFRIGGSDRKEGPSHGKISIVGKTVEKSIGATESKHRENKYYNKPKFFGKTTSIKSKKRNQSTSSEQSEQEESKAKVGLSSRRGAPQNSRRPKSATSSDSSEHPVVSRRIANSTDSSSAETSSDHKISKSARIDQRRMKDTSSGRVNIKEREDRRALGEKRNEQSKQRIKADRWTHTKNVPEKRKTKFGKSIPTAEIKAKDTNSAVQKEKSKRKMKSSAKCVHTYDKLTKPLKQILRRAFEFFDIDRSGAIEVQELEIVLQALGYEVNSFDVASEMRHTDLDYNGRLDFQEFCAFIKRIMQQKQFLMTSLREHEIRKALQSLDRDNNGYLDRKEFVYMTDQILQVQLTPTQQTSLFDFIDVNGDGMIQEEEFISFLKLYHQLQVNRLTSNLKMPKFPPTITDAIKKLIHGSPVDVDGNLLMLLGIPSNFRRAVSSFVSSGKLEQNSMEYVLSFPAPQVVTSLSQLTTTSTCNHSRPPIDVDGNLLMLLGIPSNFRRAVSSFVSSGKLEQNSMEYVLSFPAPQVVTSLSQLTTTSTCNHSRPPSYNPIETATDLAARVYNDSSNTKIEKTILAKAEKYQFQAILSLKRATGIPKPFDSRESDVVKRCVNVCIFQEYKITHRNARDRRHLPNTGIKNCFRAGRIVGNVLEIPVSWNPNEEDVWEFSKRATSKHDYKFLARTNLVSDELFLLIEFIVHLKVSDVKDNSHSLDKDLRNVKSKRNDSGERSSSSRGLVEMVCCWTKIPLYLLLERRTSTFRTREKLLGGTVFSPCEVEEDEIMRRRYGWRAFSNVFRATRPPTPIVGIKCLPIKNLPEEYQKCVYKMPPLLLLPYSAISITAEYMMYMNSLLSETSVASSGTTTGC